MYMSLPHPAYGNSSLLRVDASPPLLPCKTTPSGGRGVQPAIQRFLSRTGDVFSRSDFPPPLVDAASTSIPTFGLAAPRGRILRRFCLKCGPLVCSSCRVPASYFFFQLVSPLPPSATPPRRKVHRVPPTSAYIPLTLSCFVLRPLALATALNSSATYKPP